MQTILPATGQRWVAGQCGPKGTGRHQTIHRMGVHQGDVGTGGFVDGGTLLEWIDKVAHATAAQWCEGHCVAVSMGNFHLDRPITLGDNVGFQASIVYTERASMHILVTISYGAPDQPQEAQSTQCQMVFTAVDAFGNAVDVPRWTPVTMLELQRHRQARARARTRRRIEEVMKSASATDGGVTPWATLRVHAAAADTDRSGNVRAGRIMRWIDEAAYACGAAWTGAEVVTSYIAGVRLHQPIFSGDGVDVNARIIHTGPRSVHTAVRVTTAEPFGGRTSLIADAVVVVVSPDSQGRASAVSSWRPADDHGARLDRHARDLLELRQHLEPFTTALPLEGDPESGDPATHVA